jgi:SprB repeat
MIKKEMKVSIVLNTICNLCLSSNLINLLGYKKNIRFWIAAFGLLATTLGYSQSCLRNFNMIGPVLYSGTAGTVGSVYRFPNASSGIDVHIRIDAINNATLDSMDLTGTGYTKAWQPRITTSTGGGYIDWTISFKKGGTNIDTIICAPISAIDIDGDNENSGSGLKEYIQTTGHDTAYVVSPTELTLSNPGSGWTLRALGSYRTYSGIDVTALKVQIQVEFKNISSFVWRNGSTQSGSRLFSLYFNTFITCSNITDGGTLGGNEFGCGNSFDPNLITNVTSPAGGSGGLEYRWLSNTVSANPTDVNWQVLSATNSITYDPPVITNTTHYKRQARRTTCAEWWESSNVITKSLFPAASATITTTENACTPNDGQVTLLTNVTLAASGGVSYTWNNLLGSGASKSIIALLTNTYTVTATDANGCTATANRTITVVANPTITISATENSCTPNDNKVLGGTNVSLLANGGVNYTWNNSLGTGANKTVTPSLTTTYVVTATDANGCTGTGSLTITLTSPILITPTITNVSCSGGSNGAISLAISGGAAPYTYNWGGGITTKDRTGLVVDSYALTVTDANACTQTTSYNITTTSTLSVNPTVTNITCNGASTGAINLTVTGGTAPYTYNWSGGLTTQNRTGLTAGAYNVTVTDANGCTRVTSAPVTQPAALNISTTPTNITCNGASTGAITLTVSGGTASYAYNWGGGVTTQNRTGLTAGTYTVTVTDVNSCTQAKSVTLTQPTAITLTTSVNNITCGSGTGSINLSVSGGIAPYTYNWGGGVTSEDRTGLTLGTYNVTVTDANTCTATTSVNITQTTSASLSTSITHVLCFGASTGAIDLTALGGAPYTYVWNDGATSADRTNLTAGTYLVTVTNASGCTTTTSAMVTTPSVLAISNSLTHVLCMGGSTGAIDITATGGLAPYTYNWGGGITSEDRTGLAVGNYSVTVTDANGCTKALNLTITQPTALNLSSAVTQVSCVGGTDGAINLTVVGGTAPYTYDWGGGVTSQDRSSLAAGTYSVTVTDGNGCTASTNATLTPQGSLPNPPTVIRH